MYMYIHVTLLFKATSRQQVGYVYMYINVNRLFKYCIQPKTFECDAIHNLQVLYKVICITLSLMYGQQLHVHVHVHVRTSA